MASDDKTKVDGYFFFKEPVRAAFLNVVTPSAPRVNAGMKEAKEPNYNGTFLLVPGSEDLANAKAKVVSVARAKWPTRDLKASVASGILRFPFILGEKKAAAATKKGRDGSFYLGHVVMNAKTGLIYPPKLGILERGVIKALDTELLRAQFKAKFYHGCYVAPQVSFVAGEGNGLEPGDPGYIADYVTAYLQMVLWIKDGPQIGGRSLDDVFKDYVGQMTPNVDAAGGATDDDDEIPF